MAEDIKSLDQLRDAVTASAGAVQGSTAEESRSLQTAAVREPQRDAQGRAYATGKRKDAVARVWVKPGSGKVIVNGKEEQRRGAQLHHGDVIEVLGSGLGPVKIVSSGDAASTAE